MKKENNTGLQGFRYYLDRLHDAWLLFKLRNKPYREYYKAVMRKETRRDPHYAVGGNWEQGPAQLKRLIAQGLKPGHTLLDIGCGALRGGLHFIGYLDKGNYWGIDISNDIIEQGKNILSQSDLKDKNPTLIVTKDATFDEIGRKFDFIHAQSVLSHMPKEDIDELFKNLPTVMSKDTKFYATFFESKNNEYYPTVSQRNFYYPFILLQNMANKRGLRLERGQDVPEFKKQPLLLITLAE